MVEYLLILHSWFRYLVVCMLVLSVIIAYRGYSRGASFSKKVNAVRHWTATIAHLQLTIGVILYIKSPMIQYFLHHFDELKNDIEQVFFGIFHISLMTIAVVLLTIGSAKTKRLTTDYEKYKTMYQWFAISLIIIFMAIPWPFSPLASRPCIRPF
jgi:hypothetical protein